MNILHEYHNRFDEITTRLESGNIGIFDKIGLLWEQRQILKDWQRDIERLRKSQA